MSLEIMVFCEGKGQHASTAALEIIGKARDLSQCLSGPVAVSAVFFGEESPCFLPEFLAAGATEVVRIASTDGEELCPMGQLEGLLQLVEERKPEILFFAATALSSQLAASLAARLKTGLAAHCIDLDIDGDGQLVQVVPAFGGRILSNIYCPERRPVMATITPGTFPLTLAPEESQGKVTTFVPVERPVNRPILELVGKEEHTTGRLSLDKAEVVVAGGFGVGEEHWPLLEELADLLGAAVASTRPVIDAGWAPEETMVGTSGKNIRPKVYLGFGISGATHHTIGLKDAGVIINVNSDPDALAFSVSDWKVVADCRPVLKQLVAALKGEQGEGGSFCE